MSDRDPHAAQVVVDNVVVFEKFLDISMKRKDTTTHEKDVQRVTKRMVDELNRIKSELTRNQLKDMERRRRIKASVRGINWLTEEAAKHLEEDRFREWKERERMKEEERERKKEEERERKEEERERKEMRKKEWQQDYNRKMEAQIRMEKEETERRLALVRQYIDVEGSTSMLKFAADNHVNYGTFRYWVRKYKESNGI